MMEKTLVILKPCTLQRALVGEITSRFERKGLRLAGMKMVQLTDEVLSEHYAHLSSKPFFQRVKDSMMACPAIVCNLLDKLEKYYAEDMNLQKYKLSMAADWQKAGDCLILIMQLLKLIWLVMKLKALLVCR